MRERRLQASACALARGCGYERLRRAAGGIDVGVLRGMTNHLFSDIDASELANVTGGAGAKASWNSIKQQASPYCPTTVAKYSNLDPSTITRGNAQKIGNECIAELGPFMGSLARGTIDGAIDQALPAR